MSSMVSDKQKCVHAAEVLKAVAHPMRIRIVAFLCDKEAHVNELADFLDAPQAIVSQQLQVLRMRKLVSARRENGFAIYKINEPQLHSLIRCMEGCSK